MKKQLIKLGTSYPFLRPHIRAILSKTAWAIKSDSKEVWAELEGSRIGSLAIYDSLKQLNTDIRKKGNLAPIMEEGNEWLNLEGKIGYIPYMELPESLRGKGLGKDIAKAMLKTAKSKGVPTCILHAQHPMLRETGPQISFWTSVGFRSMRYDDGSYFGEVMGIRL